MATPLSNSTISTSSTSVNFHSSGLRQKVDQLMDILWAGGVNNPMDSIEQISYLLFLRLLSEKDEQLAALSKNYKRIFAGEWARRAWGNFVTLTGDQLFDAVRAAIESLHELPGLSDTGKLLFSRANLKIYDRPTLRAVIQSINNMDLNAHDGVDLKGDMYEYLLGKIAASGTNGQFRTPRHIIRMIVELIAPQPNERICDPAVGTAGFLIATFEYIKRRYTSTAELARGQVTGDLLTPAHWKFIEEHAFTGYDNDANMVKIAILNLYLHQLDKADIEFHNALTTNRYGTYPGALYEVILANPPFSGAIQKESILADINLPTRDTEKLFLKWIIDHLAPQGRAGVIVPNGVLFGSDKASRTLRKLLIEKHGLQAVITLPSGVFKPYAGVATAILIIENGKKAESIWFYELSADGFSLTDTRTPIADNDIPDVLAKWPAREEGDRAFSVPVSELEKMGYELTPGRYHVQEQEAAQHDAPTQIIDEVIEMEKEISRRLESLRAQVNG
jgi:type I restriction enzyme M protein